MMTVHRTAGIRQWEFEKRIPLLFRDHRLFALCRRHARVKIGARSPRSMVRDATWKFPLSWFTGRVRSVRGRAALEGTSGRCDRITTRGPLDAPRAFQRRPRRGRRNERVQVARVRRFGPGDREMSEFHALGYDLDPAGSSPTYPGAIARTRVRDSTERVRGRQGPRRGGAAATLASAPPPRRGISRREWRVETIEDQSKDVARWQLEFTKMRRRAEAAEEDNTRLKATHDEMRRKFEREHHARAALETRLRDIFSKPAVRDALASHPRGATRRDDPHGAGNVLRPGEDVDGSEAAMMVFKALEDRISRDRDALEAANAREVRLATMLRHSETQKLAAYAEAEKSSRELEAHVAKLRVDRAVAKGLERTWRR